MHANISFSIVFCKCMSPWGKVAFAQCYYFIFFMAMPKIQDLRPMQMHYDNIFYFPLNYTLIYGSICNVHFLQCFLQTGGQEGGQQTYWSSSVDQRQSHTLGMENVGPTIETCCILVTSFYFPNYWFAMTLVWVKWLPTDAPKERLWLDFLNKCGHWRYQGSLNAGICSRCRIFFFPNELGASEFSLDPADIDPLPWGLEHQEEPHLLQTRTLAGYVLQLVSQAWKTAWTYSHTYVCFCLTAE